MKNWRPLTLLLLLGIIWGTGYSIARYVTTHGVPALGYSFWQTLGPTCFIAIFALCTRELPAFSFTHARYYLICGITGIVLPNTNMYIAAMHLPAGLLAVIVNTAPIFVYLFAIVTHIESFNLMRFTAVISTLIGLMLILIPEVSLPTSHMTSWILFALFTPLCFAFCAVYINRYKPKDSSSTSLALGTLIASSLILMPLLFNADYFYPIHLPLNLTDSLILLEILLSSLGYIIFFQLIRTAGAVYYSFVDTIVALVGLFWGYLLFHEQLNSWTGPAVIFILLSLVLINKRKPPVLK